MAGNVLIRIHNAHTGKESTYTAAELTREARAAIRAARPGAPAVGGTLIGWEIHVVETGAKGRGSVLLRVHYKLADGARGTIHSAI